MLKKQRGHGAWQDYIAVECRLGLRTAQIYMYLARNKEKLGQLIAAKTQAHSYLTQSEALKFLSVARKKRRRSGARSPT